MPRADTLATLQASLEEERDHLRAQLADLDGPEMSFDENFADSGQVAAGQGESKVLEASIQDALADVEHALEKMESGGYGTCEVCGKEIAEARLEAMPATRWDIEHASGR